MQYNLNIEVTTNAINDLFNSNKPLPKMTSNTTYQPKATYWNPDANVNNVDNNINEQDSKQKGSAKLRNECYHQAARAFINSEHDKWRLYSDLGIISSRYRSHLVYY
jgi:hypothetical protein